MYYMRVCILNMKGNFDKTLGTGTQRTSYELWRNIKPLSDKQGIDIDRVEVGMGSSPGSRKISFTLLLPFKDFSKYDIVHLLIPIPITPRAGKKTKILTTVNEFLVLEKGTIPYEKLIGDQIKKGDIRSKLSGIVGSAISRQIFNSDYIAVNSTQTRSEAIKLGYPSERIFIVNHGVDERFLSKAKHKKSNKFRVGYIGALNVRKNISFAIDAFKKTSSKNTEFEIWGRQILEYQNLVKRSKGDKRIKFMGFAPEDRLVRIYDRFDAFVFPSLYEGFGLPIIEAQSRGLPVIIFKEGRIPKEIRKYCLEAKDEADMARIITDLQRKGYDRELRKRATEYARGFTRRNEALSTLNVYKRIYGKG